MSLLAEATEKVEDAAAKAKAARRAALIERGKAKAKDVKEWCGETASYRDSVNVTFTRHVSGGYLGGRGHEEMETRPVVIHRFIVDDVLLGYKDQSTRDWFLILPCTTCARNDSYVDLGYDGSPRELTQDTWEFPKGMTPEEAKKRNIKPTKRQKTAAELRKDRKKNRDGFVNKIGSIARSVHQCPSCIAQRGDRCSACDRPWSVPKAAK